MIPFIAIAVLSYLLGSIPFGYILVRMFVGVDVRDQGSGNIGATNVARTGAKGLAVATLLLDAFKGVVAVLIAYAVAATLVAREAAVHAHAASPANVVAHGSDALLHMPAMTQAAQYSYLLGAIAALFAIVGHMFPVWLGFKGGKGVATGLGVFIALAPKAVLLVIGIFVLLVAITRYVSLGSIVAAALFPLVFFALERDQSSTPVVVMIAGVSLLIIAKHAANIRRLLAGTENRLGSK
jgi:glycerol-3-phosphate acyltransferase PlsY